MVMADRGEAVALVDPVSLVAVEALMDQDPVVVVDDGKREWFHNGVRADY